MRHFLLVGLIALGCGSTTEDGNGGAAGSSGSGGSGGVDGGAGTGGGTGGSAGSGASGGAGGGASGSAGSGTAGAAGAPPSDAGSASWAACELPTGAVRYGIFKSDAARDLCFSIVVGSGAPPELAGVSVTGQFVSGIESAHVWQGAAGCGWQTPAPSGAVAANGGTGQISFQPPTPPKIVADFTLTFPAGESWVPASEPFVAPSDLIGDFDCSS